MRASAPSRIRESIGAFVKTSETNNERPRSYLSRWQGAREDVRISRVSVTVTWQWGLLSSWQGSREDVRIGRVSATVTWQWGLQKESVLVECRAKLA